MLKIHKATLSTALFLVAASIGTAQAGPNDGLASHKPSAGTAVSQDCVTRKVAVTSSDVTGNSTSSSSYVNVPDGAVTFNEGRDGCIVVDFTGYSFAPNSGSTVGLVFVQALLDGVAMFPGEIQFSANDNTYAQSHAASWTASALAGSHTVQMQFRSFTSGQSVFMHRHTTEVVHR